jgi:CubicO group peptidase (beta-lactamase class C family)
MAPGCARLRFIGAALISARDLTRFGLLYLNHGKWRDKQIVPASWAEKNSHASEMIQFHGIDTGDYEYLWWVEYGGIHFPGVKVPPGTYSARGAGGHFLVVIPARDLVIVHRFDNEPPRKDVKPVFDSVYKGINNAEFGPLLQLILDAQKLSAPQGTLTSRAKRLAGDLPKAALAQAVRRVETMMPHRRTSP